MTEVQLDNEVGLCDFCRSVDWAEVTTSFFNPHKAALENGQLKSGEHNLGAIHTAAETCELCKLISNGSHNLKPWSPVAEFHDRPDNLTCAFWSSRSRLGSSVLATRLSQADSLLDTFFAGENPGYSSTNLVIQNFFDSLERRGIFLDADKASGDGKRRNNSLNRLLLHPCLYPVPRVDDYVTGEEPFSVFPSGRVVESEVNVGLLRKWYETCLEKHGEKCSLPPWIAPDTSWPEKLRLIDVRRHCLVEVSDPCPYFALSYVWGDERRGPFQTILSNVEEMKTPGFLGSQLLPKTIVDAIELTKQMGVEFIWVDRLCIIQDSEADKVVQIPQMDLVYSRAELTVVAACGTATDGLPGINSTTRNINQLTARVAKDLGLTDVLNLDQEYQDSRWKTRGWTFQEGLCSRRTLIIASDQVFWSCETSKCCETIAFEAFPTAVASNDIIFSVLSGHKIFGEFGGGNNFAYSELSSMIQGYCNRKLTVQADVLDAFSGVLRRVGVNTGHEFYWGHSVSTRFDEGLAWNNIVWYRDRKWKSHELPERRRELHRVISSDGTVHRVVLEPELNIMKLSMGGKAAPLRSLSNEKTFESASKIDMCGIDNTTSAGWKGNTTIDPSLLHQDTEDGDFMDSGRLLFWTSHAVLVLEENKIYNDKKEEVGELNPFLPHQAPKLSGKHSFIVVSRKHNDNSLKILKAERKLNVLVVEWDDPVRRVASRVSTGEINEEAWVGLAEEREWILVTLA
ncbi:hypothetical protein GL218_00699 [Daldinia childiae]|uniref:uncharacterized protein n=1 Tax=Daldinia childiae TaxID=326645 RepID=UPI001446DB05|nr:uncharacterized protein GL218_00699 [Daldinia childiae]KAF3071086.1 hypothetical protein GL218_00699 [Daldinia childiae]